jgi:hypothetical protein
VKRQLHPWRSPIVCKHSRRRRFRPPPPLARGLGSNGLPSPCLSRSVGEEGGLGGKVRAALTPGPSPALRERGDLGGGLGIVDRCQRGIAPLIPPFRSRSVREEGGWGEGEGRPPPSAPAAWERKGAGGKVRAALPPSSPAAWERKEAGGKVRAALPLPLPQRGRGRGLGGR